MNLRSWGAFIAMIAASLFSGCESNTLPTAMPGIPDATPVASAMTEAAPVAPLDPALLQAPTTPFRLGPGDQVDIELVGEPSSGATVTVGPDGKIYYYLLPGLDVWGLTLPEARDRLDRELRKYIRELPVVTLSLRTQASQRFWMLGRVGNPGVYTLDGPTSLLDALAQAGGLASVVAQTTGAAGSSAGAGSSNLENADLSRSFIIRQGHFLPVDFQRLLREGDLSQNIYLQPNDFIFLPSSHSARVHVLGAVVRPQSERTSGALTLAESIALAGGTEPQACLSNVAVLRGSLAHPQVAIFAVDEIVHGKAPDVRLQPNDIVYVPYSTNRVLVRYVNLILDTFVRTVGVNEGVYAVTGQNTPVSVGVNLTP
jgi:polysaccharide biosynthesis/export protein